MTANRFTDNFQIKRTKYKKQKETGLFTYRAIGLIMLKRDVIHKTGSTYRKFATFPVEATAINKLENAQKFGDVPPCKFQDM